MTKDHKNPEEPGLFPARLNAALYAKVLGNAKKSTSDAVNALGKAGVLERSAAYSFLGGKTSGRGDAFGVLAALVGREATTFVDAPPERAEYDRVVELFALRIEKLILTGGIPPTFEGEDGQRHLTDVVSYAWHLGDPVLSSIPITYHQQREAFELVKRWDLLEEWPLKEKVNGRERLLGRLTIATVDHTLVLHDLSQRRHLETRAINLLERSEGHWRKVQKRFAERMLLYKQHAIVDPKNKLEIKCEAAIDNDWNCRRAWLISGADETALAARYRHSRFALETLRRRMLDQDASNGTETFFRYWTNRLAFNTKNLKAIHSALGTPGQEPDFTSFKREVKNSHRMIKSMINRAFGITGTQAKDKSSG